MIQRPISLLFIPGHQERMLAKAGELQADAIVFDLEDSVPPAAKSQARELVAGKLNESARGPSRCYVRLNAPRTGQIEDDARALEGHDDAGLVITKIDRAAELEQLRDFPALHNRQVIVTIETPRALLNAHSIADHALVDGLCLGGEDLAMLVGLQRTAGGQELDLARWQVLIAARAAGIAAYDAICPEFRDLDIVTQDAERAARMGFDGKFAIHPAQLEPIHDAFRPSQEEISWARDVVQAYDAALAAGNAAVQVEGQMVDPPVAERCRRLLQRWDVAGS